MAKNAKTKEKAVKTNYASIIQISIVNENIIMSVNIIKSVNAMSTVKSLIWP